jgi:hypothetical protein
MVRNPCEKRRFAGPGGLAPEFFHSGATGASMPTHAVPHLAVARGVPSRQSRGARPRWRGSWRAAPRQRLALPAELAGLPDRAGLASTWRPAGRAGGFIRPLRIGGPGSRPRDGVTRPFVSLAGRAAPFAGAREGQGRRAVRHRTEGARWPRKMIPARPAGSALREGHRLARPLSEGAALDPMRQGGPRGPPGPSGGQQHRPPPPGAGAGGPA